MMFKKNQFRESDPFRLSTLGRGRAFVAWLRGPALMRRWLVLLLSATSMMCLVVVLVLAFVMHGASPSVPSPADMTSRDIQAEAFRAGPTASKVVDRPGFDCHPMPNLGLKYLNPMNTGPSVVAIGKDGVVWGPMCIVTDGWAGS